MIELLCFVTDTCPNCPAMKKEVAKYPEYRVVNCSTPEGFGLASRYGIQAVPTLAVVEDGKLISRDNRVEKVKIFKEVFLA
jgi:thioredoxin-related protein